MPQDELLVHEQDSIMTVTLNRPDALNALTIGMIDTFSTALDQALKNDVRVVVIAAAGRAFCAGMDVSGFGKEPGDSLPALAHLQDFLVRLAEFPKPVIAQVNGTAMGGGTELILAADFAIAAETARVGDGHTNIGVIPGGGGATLLARRVPVSIAKYVVFTGIRLTASEWQRYGLFAEVVPLDGLASRVAELATSIADKSPLGLSTIKSLMLESAADTDPATSLARELEANRTYSTSYDMSEGLQAFANNRKPKFLGR
ncbi:enoyl-CoA hydratase/carnithine racemase [Leucobacter exalbidus]|uniref:Enoyl-CoA hydratase/carnithine racemase n=1 Tax=Leucobacter exalbidus TaxID=662960 RepID=A0A940T3J7_9MICO|nr:enoyl-CoA hydratase-related protein [Leucobacter exalbidus]MBP1325829.1 enoyl-CoA hydratase/carnithine racemase [Leucobacter exalbidus]